MAGYFDESIIPYYTRNTQGASYLTGHQTVAGAGSKQQRNDSLIRIQGVKTDYTVFHSTNCTRN